MKRVVALFVAVMYMSVATAFAQEPIARHASASRPVTFAPNPPAPRFSLFRAIPQLPKVTAMAAPAPLLFTPASRANVWAMAMPPNAKGGKSFWKTPWPYVIAGGVIATVVIVKKKGYSNGGACPPGQELNCNIY